VQPREAIMDFAPTTRTNSLCLAEGGGEGFSGSPQWRNLLDYPATDPAAKRE